MNRHYDTSVPKEGGPVLVCVSCSTMLGMRSAFPVGTRLTNCEICNAIIGDSDKRHAFPASLRGHLQRRGATLLGKTV